MASTIQTAKLTVVHTESWTLNDGAYEDTVKELDAFLDNRLQDRLLL